MSVIVRVVPLELEIHVEDGETLMEAAERLGWYWPTICHGEAQCSVCWFEVLAGIEELAPPAADELRTLDLLGRHLRSKAPGTIRLGCQSRPEGNLVIKKTGLRRIARTD